MKNEKKEVCSMALLPKQCLRYLETIAPRDLACSWDNVGLLVDAGLAVKSILVALDITPEVVLEAAAAECQLIVSHHPVIFQPLKTLEAGSVPALLLQNHISAICMHTNLDAAEGGVNDVLAGLLQLQDTEVFADGYGRIGWMEKSCSVSSLALFCSQILSTRCKYVEADGVVHRIAVVSGAGGSYLQEAIDRDADCLVTGEASHHIALDAKNLGVGLIVAGHWGTEHPVVKALAHRLRMDLPKEIQVLTSRCDVDPYCYI